MPDLANFQRSFAKALRDDAQPEPLLRSQAFAVYRNTSARGVVEALRATFPTVDALLGSDGFTQVALDYRRETPPASPVLSDYGADFADFLARQPWTGELPYLSDVAQLDRMWLDSLLAAGTESPPGPFDLEARIVIHPAARFAWLATPALTIWQAHRDGFDELEPDWCEEGALFTRPDLAVRIESIDLEAHRLLLACAIPTPVDECIASVAEGFPNIDVPALVRRCVASGALITL